MAGKVVSVGTWWSFEVASDLSTHLVTSGGEMLSNLLVHLMDILLFICFTCLLGRHDALVVNKVWELLMSGKVKRERISRGSRFVTHNI